jgi:hypothetical protein
MSKRTLYRYVGKTFRTRWRLAPHDGLRRPPKATREKLGPGYSLQIRETPPPTCCGRTMTIDSPE